MTLTSYHAKHFANDLTRRATGGIDRLSMSLFDAAVEINPHQVEAALFALHSPVSQGVTEARERMQPEQKALYYITGGSESMLRNSPCLRSTRRRVLRSSSA